MSANRIRHLTKSFTGVTMMRDSFSPHGFLYEQLDILSRFHALNEEMPDSITQNLNPAFEIREYQEEAFARFIYCLREDFDGKVHHFISYLTWRPVVVRRLSWRD